MHIENLMTLANYLETLPAPKFDMKQFAADEHGDWLSPNQLHECDTVCCAAGNGPAAGLPVIESDHDWQTYIERVFGIELYTREWHWCFSAGWAYVDNTPAGAARRIRHMLEHGVPDNGENQMWGKAQYVCAANL